MKIANPNEEDVMGNDFVGVLVQMNRADSDRATELALSIDKRKYNFKHLMELLLSFEPAYEKDESEGLEDRAIIREILADKFGVELSAEVLISYLDAFKTSDNRGWALQILRSVYSSMLDIDQAASLIRMGPSEVREFGKEVILGIIEANAITCENVFSFYPNIVDPSDKAAIHIFTALMERDDESALEKSFRKKFSV